jgi:hypothetical protein
MWADVKKWVRDVFSSGTHVLDHPTLLRAAEDGILALRRHGDAGRDVFPPGVRVRITVREGSVETVRGFVTHPGFDQELHAALLNRLVHSGAALPVRTYEVSRGDTDAVEVVEDTAAIVAVLVIEGGNRAGDRFAVENVRREWRIGRGRWHDDEERVANDIVLTDDEKYVSRAAAVLRRGGALLEVATRKQGDCLVVHRSDGTQVRPANIASGWCPLEVGDCVELHDGRSTGLRLRVVAPPRATEDG